MAVLHDIHIGQVRLIYTDRTGGVGTDSFASANLSFRVGDSYPIVLENRRRIAKELGITSKWFEVAQVHGATVADVSEASITKEATAVDALSKLDCTTSEDSAQTPDTQGSPHDHVIAADAIVAVGQSPPMAIYTADCVPLAVGSYDPPGVALVHAGWRGLAEGVVEAAAGRLYDKTKRLDWAVAGPSVRPCCYRVEDRRLAYFEKRFGSRVVCRDSGSLDLHAVSLEALKLAGLAPQSFSSLGPCTACSPDLFSYRRDGPRTGRQALIAWIEA